MNNFFKNINFLCFVLILNSCTNVSPLYKSDKNKELNNIKVLYVGGRYGVYLKNELDETYGSGFVDPNKKIYYLETSVDTGEDSVQAYNDDGTASRFISVVTVSYKVLDNSKCVIYSGSNATKASYNSKSSGYDYGNIASKNAAVEKNIEYNVKQFYPHIYNAIVNRKTPIAPIAPFLAIEDQIFCHL